MSRSSDDQDLLLEFDLEFLSGSPRDNFTEVRERFRVYFPEAVWNEERAIFTPTPFSVLFLGWLTAYVDRGVISERERKDFLKRLAAYNRSRKK